jgi:hypothetical protein
MRTSLAPFANRKGLDLRDDEDLGTALLRAVELGRLDESRGKRATRTGAQICRSVKGGRWFAVHIQALRAAYRAARENVMARKR